MNTLEDLIATGSDVRVPAFPQAPEEDGVRGAYPDAPIQF